MRLASSRNGGRSAPPKAGSTSCGSATLRPVVSQMNESGIRVSLFIAADPAQIEAAAAIGTPVIEIHTGAWCDAVVAQRYRGCQR